MDELIKLLDKNLDYVSHEIINNVYYISTVSNRVEVKCPYCGCITSSVHSTYEKRFQDLPIQGNKVYIMISNRKMFCKNSNCSYKTFAERFNFICNKAKKTKRLENEISRISLNCSSVVASEILRNGIVDVGKSTICNIIKKRKTNY